MIKKVAVINLGYIGYREAYRIQKEIFNLCYSGDLYDTIIFQKNNPTITIGRSGIKEHLLVDEKRLEEMNIDVVSVDRGGDITYHGPGQCIVSLILHIKTYTNNIHDYLRQLEEVVIILLLNYGIVANRVSGLSGVWVDNKKIASIGISIEHGITRHGIAINVNPDLHYYDMIVACGIKDVQMTSIKELVNVNISVEQVENDFLHSFSELFKVQYNYLDYTKGVIDYEDRSKSTKFCRRRN